MVVGGSKVCFDPQQWRSDSSIRFYGISMPALLLKADIRQGDVYVRLVPIAEMTATGGFTFTTTKKPRTMPGLLVCCVGQRSVLGDDRATPVEEVGQLTADPLHPLLGFE